MRERRQGLDHAEGFSLEVVGLRGGSEEELEVRNLLLELRGEVDPKPLLGGVEVEGSDNGGEGMPVVEALEFLHDESPAAKGRRLAAIAKGFLDVALDVLLECLGNDQTRKVKKQKGRGKGGDERSRER